MFKEDTMVQPKETSWFQFYKKGQDVEVEKFEESDIYTKDLLGLQQMHKQGKLVFLESPGNHLQMSLEFFSEHVLQHLK